MYNVTQFKINLFKRYNVPVLACSSNYYVIFVLYQWIKIYHWTINILGVPVFSDAKKTKSDIDVQG